MNRPAYAGLTVALSAVACIMANAVREPSLMSIRGFREADRG